jgi:hypothetical protein
MVLMRTSTSIGVHLVLVLFVFAIVPVTMALHFVVTQPSGIQPAPASVGVSSQQQNDAEQHAPFTPSFK